MAYSNAQFGYHPAPSKTLITRRPSYHYDLPDDDDSAAVLDSSILDADIMQSPADAQPRKPSFPHANPVLTPVDSQPWNPAYGVALALDPSCARAPHPFDDDQHAFSARPPPHIATFGHPPPPASWEFEHGSGHCTPTNGQELDFGQPPPPGFEHPQYVHHRNDSARGSFSYQHPPPPPHHFNRPPPDATFAPAPQVQTPMSPHSNQDYMAMAANEIEAARRSKRMRTSSPSRTSVDIQRGDGIRKKNGRIEIPQERNIQTIDDLIDNASDEDLLKELKQQKRLLRNREAA